MWFGYSVPRSIGLKSCFLISIYGTSFSVSTTVRLDPRPEYREKDVSDDIQWDCRVRRNYFLVTHRP